MTLADKIEIWVVVAFIKVCVRMIVWYYKIAEWMEEE